MVGSEALWGQARWPAARCCVKVLLRFCYRDAGSAPVTALDARCVGLVETRITLRIVHNLQVVTLYPLN